MKTKKIKCPKCGKKIHPSYMELHLRRKHDVTSELIEDSSSETEVDPATCINSFLDYLEQRKTNIMLNAQKAVESLDQLEIEIRSLLE